MRRTKEGLLNRQTLLTQTLYPKIGYVQKLARFFRSLV